MFSTIFGFLSNLFGLGSSVSKEITQRDTEHNTPALVANANAAADTKEDAEIDQDIAKGDLKAVQKDEAEAP